MVFNGGSGMAPGFPPPALADYLPRVGAALLDALFLLLLGCIPNGVLLALLLAVTANNPDGPQIAAALFNTCSSVIGFVIGAIYYVGLEASAKQGTWGKQIVGLKVTDIEGRRIGVGRAIGRLFARYLSICTCGIGYLLPLFTKNRQTLHDLICGCVVLNK
ncbi:MAG: RDD family protein [Planctomycetia bacterium]